MSARKKLGIHFEKMDTDEGSEDTQNIPEEVTCFTDPL
jgi:hypothetical protein